MITTEQLSLSYEELGVKERGLYTIQLRRPPIHIECSCDFTTTIVLPVGRGLLVWYCDKCDKGWRIEYGPKGGLLSRQI